MLTRIRASEEWQDKGALAKGFTLVELLVVIVILGILAAVVVFAVNGISDRGQKSACDTDEQILRTAVEAYRAQNSASAKPSEKDLVRAGLLSEESALHNISYSGNTVRITAVRGSGC